MRWVGAPVLKLLRKGENFRLHRVDLLLGKTHMHSDGVNRRRGGAVALCRG